MNPGRLKHKIIFKLLTVIPGEYGPEETWADYKTRWAEVKPLTGKAFYSAMQINSEITHQVIIRYTDGIKPNMKIAYKGREFDILYVMNYEEGNELLQILCKELVK